MRHRDRMITANRNDDATGSAHDLILRSHDATAESQDTTLGSHGTTMESHDATLLSHEQLADGILVGQNGTP